MITISPDSDQLLRGNFSVYFAELNSSGVPQGERHVGNCSAISLTAEPDVITKEQRMTSPRGPYKEVSRSVKITAAFTLDEITMENLGLFGLGEVVAHGQGASTLVDHEVTASSKQGYYYSVGKRDISSVTVEADGDAVTLGDDYTVDAAQGRIYIVPGGAITDGLPVTVSCSYAAVTSKTMRLATATNTKHYVRLVGDPDDGPTHDVELWCVKLVPAGAFDLITDEFASIALTGTVYNDKANHSSAPYGHIIERTAA